MDKARHNLTLVLDEDLLLAARKVALDRHSSVNQMVREYLSTIVGESTRKRLALERLKMRLGIGIVEIGDQTWSRDDLYDR